MISFIFNGKDSFNDYGIIIAKRPSFPSPKRRVSYVNIPGRDSSLRYDEGTYEDITVVVECTIKGSNFLERLDNIKAWLFSAEESDLIFSFQDDKKYRAQVVNAIDFKQVFKYGSKFPIVFNCRPFKYSIENNLVVLSHSLHQVTNPGTIESEPIILVYGSGDIVLKINDDQMNLTGITEKIIINSEIQDCYYKDNKSQNEKVAGEFPRLKPGINIIEWIGNVSKVEILPNWRWL